MTYKIHSGSRHGANYGFECFAAGAPTLIRAHFSTGALSERHLQIIGTVPTVVRASATLVISAVTLLDPASHGGMNRIFMTALVAWSFYRIVQTAPTRPAMTVDFAWAVLAAALTPALESATQVGSSEAVPFSIVAVSVYTLAVQVALRWALPMLVVALASYGWGTAQLIGWTGAGDVDDFYQIVFGWAIAVLLRVIILRIAAAVDESHTDRLTAELNNRVNEARRNFISEQLAVLHDTAAATLLLVGQGSPIASERLAAQARRDLQILQAMPRVEGDGPTDVVPLLRDATDRLGADVVINGLPELWLPADLATVVAAAAREAVINAVRHAGAGSITVDIGSRYVAVDDNGTGFAQDAQIGHGIAESIVGRMNRAGGYATIRTHSRGTTVTIRWDSPKPVEEHINSAVDTISVLSAGYGAAFAILAIANLIATVEWSPIEHEHRPMQWVLALLAGLCALAALPARQRGWRWMAPLAAVALGAIALVQQAGLPTAELSTDANWSQLAIGLCILPHALSWPSGRVAAILLALWTVPAAATLARAPGWSTLLFLAASAAAYLIPQLGVAKFSSLARTAAAEASREDQARLLALGREHIAQALQDEYLDRYAAVVDRVTPLLSSLSRGHPVTPVIQQQARIESQRLRALFDEAASNNRQLLQHLRKAIKPAQDRGLEVSLHVDDDLPLLAADAVADLLNRVTDLLEMTDSHARIVLTNGGEGTIAVSVLADLTDQPHSGLRSDTMQFVSNDGSTWVTFSTGAYRQESDDRAPA